MTIAIITLSSKGQVVIPKEIRDELHWEAGLELTIETTESGVLLKSRAAGKKLRLEDLRGFLKYGGPPISTEELCKPVDYRADWEEAGKRSR
jgi:AbrB family looped-hinge helix DNA binding protein